MISVPQIILFLNLGSGEVFVIVLVIIMFFGSDKIPEMARAFAKGMKEMKNAAAEIQSEIEKSATEIQREINLQADMNELKDAANKLTTHVQEGLESGDEKVAPKQDEVKKDDAVKDDAVQHDEVKKDGDDPHPLAPEDSVKRG